MLQSMGSQRVRYNLVSLKSPALVGRFFTARATGEAPLVTLRDDRIETE